MIPHILVLVLLGIAFILGGVEVVRSRAASLLAWAVCLGFGALFLQAIG